MFWLNFIIIHSIKYDMKIWQVYMIISVLFYIYFLLFLNCRDAKKKKKEKAKGKAILFTILINCQNLS